MSSFGKSRAYKKLAKGSVGWFCEWCGQELFFKKDSKPEEILEAARDHNVSCKENPYVKQIVTGKVIDD